MADSIVFRFAKAKAFESLHSLDPCASVIFMSNQFSFGPHAKFISQAVVALRIIYLHASFCVFARVPANCASHLNGEKVKLLAGS